MPSIEVKNISKAFEDSIAIEDISFYLEEGKLLTLLGPSGSGKTTILRLIAGLIELDTGKILFDGEDVSKIPTEDRNIGFVFQSYALFPHLPVAENIAFGLETRKWSKEEIISRVKEMLELVGLQGKGKRFPRELSGGEKSRVALARALAPKPSLLLLDEPLSALDMNLKENLRQVIRNIQQKVQVSTIYVTHDQTEAMEISDQIIVLDKGKIIESGSPKQIYLEPKRKFTAEFLGISNLIEGITSKGKENFILETSFGKLDLPEINVNNNQNLTIAIFPEHLELNKKKIGNKNEFPAEVIQLSFGGSITSLTVQLDGEEMEIHFSSSRTKYQFKKGERVFITIPLNSIKVLED
ncbi:MAG: ABC transporter ATP-binding protein [Candidatus Heimdallarchaeota archaeon]|nr:ABC transporter ATP-binding protein [Candidatus Heimdallarchaeota archaeon]